MGRKSALAAETVTIEESLISNYVRFCIEEGVRPRDAYEELERRLRAVKELKDPKTL
jgi:hypothetical protein